MTDLDYQQEQHLRALMAAERSADVACVMADFYEQRGQVSRAELWRIEATARRWHRRVPDRVICDVKWQRKVMLWLFSHFMSHAEAARAFRSSVSWARTLSHQVETAICEAANMERQHPTLEATRRLQVARALPPPYVRGVFQLNETPPESWPITRDCERPAARQVRNQRTIRKHTQGELNAE